MDAFIAALNTWFDTHSDVSQRTVALNASLPGPDLSKFRAGKRPITLDALTKLLPAIERLSDRSQARALLVAYLNDETPAEYQPDVRIYAVNEDTGTVDLDDIAITRDRWERKARTDSEFAKMWLMLDGYMHEPDAEAVDARLAARESESTIALLAEPKAKCKTSGGGGFHDTIRHDAIPSQHAAQEHQEP